MRVGKGTVLLAEENCLLPRERSELRALLAATGSVPELPEEKMFAATSHIMMAVAVRYAQGLVYSAENEADRTEEYLLLKRMILREFTAN